MFHDLAADACEGNWPRLLLVGYCRITLGLLPIRRYLSAHCSKAPKMPHKAGAITELRYFNTRGWGPSGPTVSIGSMC